MWAQLSSVFYDLRLDESTLSRFGMGKSHRKRTQNPSEHSGDETWYQMFTEFTWARWSSPVTSSTQDAEVGGQLVQGQPELLRETLS